MSSAYQGINNIHIMTHHKQASGEKPFNRANIYPSLSLMMDKSCRNDGAINYERYHYHYSSGFFATSLSEKWVCFCHEVVSSDCMTFWADVASCDAHCDNNYILHSGVMTSSVERRREESWYPEIISQPHGPQWSLAWAWWNQFSISFCDLHFGFPPEWWEMMKDDCLRLSDNTLQVVPLNVAASFIIHAVLPSSSF